MAVTRTRAAARLARPSRRGRAAARASAAPAAGRRPRAFEAALQELKVATWWAYLEFIPDTLQLGLVKLKHVKNNATWDREGAAGFNALAYLGLIHLRKGLDDAAAR